MGISIRVLDETEAYPRALVTSFGCDTGCGRSADLSGSYVAAHGEAMKIGWLERQGREGRLWLCPACSGK